LDECLRKGREKFVEMNWGRNKFLTLWASKNLVGPGNPRPSARHWLW